MFQTSIISICIWIWTGSGCSLTQKVFLFVRLFLIKCEPCNYASWNICFQNILKLVLNAADINEGFSFNFIQRFLFNNNKN